MWSALLGLRYMVSSKPNYSRVIQVSCYVSHVMWCLTVTDTDFFIMTYSSYINIKFASKSGTHPSSSEMILHSSILL